MIAVRNWFPRGCMAPNGCDDAACVLCAHATSVEVLDQADVRPQDNPARDGAPTLSGERERQNIMFRKRHRDGPHRGNA